MRKMRLIVLLMVLVVGASSLMAKTTELREQLIDKGNYSKLGTVEGIEVYRENTFINHRYVYITKNECFVTRNTHVEELVVNLDTLGVSATGIETIAELVNGDLKVKRNVLGFMALFITFFVVKGLTEKAASIKQIERDKKIKHKKDLEEKLMKERKLMEEFLDTYNKKRASA